MSERQRRLETIVADSLASVRVVVVPGPRQAGKTTLVRRVLGDEGSLARLDDEATLQAAIADPEGFVATRIHADSGLAAHVLGKDPTSLRRPDDPARGPLIETFVIDELLRQTSFLDEPEVRLHHLRDRDGAEVDIIAEASDGRVVALDVKASRSVNQADAKWLAWLRDKISDDFVCGIVLHTGDRAFRLGDRLLAAPIAALWLTD